MGGVCLKLFYKWVNSAGNRSIRSAICRPLSSLSTVKIHGRRFMCRGSVSFHAGSSLQRRIAAFGDNYFSSAASWQPRSIDVSRGRDFIPRVKLSNGIHRNWKLLCPLDICNSPTVHESRVSELDFAPRRAYKSNIENFISMLPLLYSLRLANFRARHSPSTANSTRLSKWL